MPRFGCRRLSVLGRRHEEPGELDEARNQARRKHAAEAVDDKRTRTIRCAQLERNPCTTL